MPVLESPPFRRHQLSAAALRKENSALRAEVLDLRQQLAAKHEGEINFRVLADGMPHFVWTTDTSGEIDWFNAWCTTYTGISFPRDWRDPVHPDDIAECERLWACALATGKAYQSEARYRRGSDKAYRWHLGRAVPVRDNQGTIVRWIGTNTDVHDQIQAEKVLKKAISDRDAFLSSASHELKTPLTAMLLQAQIILRSARRGHTAMAVEKLLKFVERTDASARRLARLVDDMLDISRIAAGRMTVVREHFDLCELVQETVDQMSPEAAARHISVRFVGGSPVMGYWDAFRIEQVITNLLTNAYRYGEGTPVLVSVTADEYAATLRVSDHGAGIAAEDQERIFDRFERATTTNSRTGLGLGLHICREIVTRHAGSIRVESAPGQGATFVVQLPIC